ncbi:MAG: hypothetical protein WCA01_09610 [Burkholderiales bacterium]
MIYVMTSQRVWNSIAATQPRTVHQPMAQRYCASAASMGELVSNVPLFKGLSGEVLAGIRLEFGQLDLPRGTTHSPRSGTTRALRSGSSRG